MAPVPAFANLYNDAHEMLRGVLDACEPGVLLKPHLAQVPAGRPVHLVSIGKASVRLCAAAGEVFGDRVRFGICTSGAAHAGRPAGFPPTVGLMHADHPLPTQANLEAAEAVRFVVSECATAAGRADESELLVLISGGGSAHLTLPAAGVTLDDVRELTAAMLKRSATINEINCVRKHIEQLKGGRLAALAHPARVRALVLSDVVGDPLDVIASGPCAPDPTRYKDALAILERHRIKAPPRVTRLLERGADGELEETPKPGDPRLASVSHTIIGSNDMAVSALAAGAESLGFRVLRRGLGTQGISREVGAALGREAMELRKRGESGVAIVIGGETTVEVTGRGAGGRNQELVLAAALEIAGAAEVAVLAFATDGVDGPTDAAGGLVTGNTVPESRRLGLDPRARLDDNDAYSVLGRLEEAGHQALFRTGPTGTNVNDVAVALVY